jgi:hypothetical protein
MENTVPLIDCIIEITGKAIAMRGNEYVYLHSKETVEPSILAEAEALKVEKEKPMVPSSITPRQARLYLHQNGLLDKIEAMIAQDKVYQIEWEYATTIERNSPLTQAIITELGLSATETDAMFVEASGL